MGHPDVRNEFAGQAVGVENGLEVAVAGEERGRGGLEVGLGELGFEEEGGGGAGEDEVNLSAVERLAWEGAFAAGLERRGEWHAGAGAEARLSGAIDAEECGDPWLEFGSVGDLRVAEDVHQQGVGTGGGI